MPPAHRMRPVRPSINCDATRARTGHGLCHALVAPFAEGAPEDEHGKLEFNGEDVSVEAEAVRIAQDAGQPTRQQVEVHRTLGHISYRALCQ